MHIISTIGVQSMVEVGSFSGWTGVLLAHFLRHVRSERAVNSSSLDITDYRQLCTASLMELAGHHFEVVAEDRSYISHMPTKVDLCFIDGDHSYQGVSDDVRMWRNRCKVRVDNLEL
jgi:predicted O-methyltransferase YrrM